MTPSRPGRRSGLTLGRLTLAGSVASRPSRCGTPTLTATESSGSMPSHHLSATRSWSMIAGRFSKLKGRPTMNGNTTIPTATTTPGTPARLHPTETNMSHPLISQPGPPNAEVKALQSANVLLSSRTGLFGVYGETPYELLSRSTGVSHTVTSLDGSCAILGASEANLEDECRSFEMLPRTRCSPTPRCNIDGTVRQHGTGLRT